jgi:hypothetical protein
MVRCVPRFGYDNTEVRTVDLDLPRDADENELLGALHFYFAGRGIPDAVFDIACDDNGFFAVINDEAFEWDWGKPLF